MKLKLIVLAALVLIAAGCHEHSQFDIETVALKHGQVGQAYADTIRTSGGYDAAEVYLLSGQLPPGIALRTDDECGLLYGTPQLAGDYLFTVEAVSGSDSDGNSGAYVSRGFLLTIRP